jgi:hypothetical protein
MIHRLLLTHIVGSIIDKRVISVWRCNKSCKNDPQFSHKMLTYKIESESKLWSFQRVTCNILIDVINIS